MVALRAREITLVLTTLLATLTGCGLLAGGQGDAPVTLDTPFTLAVGHSAALPGTDLRITFETVQRDGRCPSQVNCVEQGAVEILVVTKEGDAAPVSHEMNPDPAPAQLGWAPTSVTVGGYVLELQAVTPYPERPEDLERFDDYQATFVVATAGGR